MSDPIALSAQHRTVTGKQVAQLRRDGITPITVYGHATEPLVLQVDTHELAQVLSTGGSSRVIAITVPGEPRPRTTLVRDVQRHVTRFTLLHADFLQVAMDEQVRSEVHLEFVGEPQLVQRHEALIEHDVTHLTVEALPADLPSVVVVNCDALEHIGDTITVADLLGSAKFQILHEPETVVVRLQAISRKVEEEAAVEVEEVPEPEVLTARAHEKDAGGD
jgi:large subunit ribosomal protein L25